jgi:hypothetical protein
MPLDGPEWSTLSGSLLPQLLYKAIKGFDFGPECLRQFGNHAARGKR